MCNMRSTKLGRRLVVILSGLALITAASVAFAAWTATGDGTGSAAATSATKLGISGSTVSSLYPGASVNMTVTLTNPNPYPVHVHELAADVAAPSVDADHPGCDLTGVTLNGPFTTSALTGSTVPAKGIVDGSSTVTLTGAVAATNGIKNECQGATFTFPLKISSGESAAAPHA